MCKGAHSIRKCVLFTNHNPSDRFQTAKRLTLCINCLGSDHTAAACPLKNTCNSCQKQHHSLLHFLVSTAENKDVSPPTSMIVALKKPQSVLLSTLLVSVADVNCQNHTLRALWIRKLVSLQNSVQIASHYVTVAAQHKSTPSQVHQSTSCPASHQL